MAKKSALPVVLYNPYVLPPRQYWKISLNIPRNTVGTFLENLQALIKQRQGASIYGPNISDDSNICRFEWNRRWKGDKFGLRLGLHFTVTKDPLTEIEAYVTTKDLIGATEGKVKLETKLITDVQKEIFQLLYKAEQGKVGKEKEWVVVSHIETPPHLGFKATIESANGNFRFLKTRILNKTLSRISAVLIRTHAVSKESAETKAMRDINAVLALLTLAESSRYQLATIIWPRSTSFARIFPPTKRINEDNFYPRRRHNPETEPMDKEVMTRFDILWDAYGVLEEADKKLFTSSLFAHYGAVYQHLNHSTLSTIGHMAALAALAQPLRATCCGKLSCTVCGELSWKHDEKSEVAAIIESITSTCDIKDKKQIEELGKLIKRVHRNQRSAFVHSAEFRHAEYGQESNLDASPSNGAAVNDLFLYREDLMSIGATTRRMLIEWLLKKAGKKIDYKIMKINPEKIVYTTTMTATITASSKFMATIATRPPGEVTSPPNSPVKVQIIESPPISKESELDKA